MEEARDINMHLKTINYLFEEFVQTDFDQALKDLDPMMHVVCLIWANSRFYNNPGRIVVLLQEICNMLIRSVSAS